MGGIEEAAGHIEYARQAILAGAEETRMAKQDGRSAKRILSQLLNSFTVVTGDFLFREFLESLDMRPGSWFTSPEEPYQTVRNSMSDASVRCADALHMFDRLVGDTDNSDAQSVRLYGSLACHQFEGEALAGDTNLPDTVNSIETDIKFITDRINTAKTLGQEILQELGILDKTLDSLEGVQEYVAEGMKQTLRTL